MDLPEHKLTPEQTSAIRAAFNKFDTDHSGSLSKQELRALLETTLKRKISDHLFESYLKLQFRATDKDFNKQIDFNEFTSLYSKIYINPELPISMKSKEGAHPALESGANSPKISHPEITLTPEEEAEARADFKKYDKDGSGSIDRSELKELLVSTMSRKMGDGVVNRLVDSQMQLADKDESGEISLDEFLVVYAKLKKGAGAPPMGMALPGMEFSRPNANASSILDSARSLCSAFANKSPIETIVAHFTPSPALHEHGPLVPSIPFLGRTFIDPSQYFAMLAQHLAYEDMEFFDYMCDEQQREVSVKGRARWT